MPMSYQDMVAIGANLNSAIERALREQAGEEFHTISDWIGPIAQAVLVQLDQAGYEIVQKGGR